MGPRHLGLSKAERGSLLLPAQREMGVLDQQRRGETFRLSPFEDGGGDIGGEIGKAEDLAEVGPMQPLVRRQIGKPADLGRSASTSRYCRANCAMPTVPHD
jgi:hypothetical protein